MRNCYPPYCSPGAGQALPALRLALRDFLLPGGPEVGKTGKYLLRALFT